MHAALERFRLSPKAPIAELETLHVSPINSHVPRTYFSSSLALSILNLVLSTLLISSCPRGD